MEVEVVNDSGRSSQEVWLTLHDGSSSDGQLVADVPKQLSEVHESRFDIGAIEAGRLFVSYGAGVGPAEPPEAPTRYDKIEFTDPGVANLTSVDFFAIPFALESLEASGARAGDALGFRCYTSTLLGRLRALAPAAELSSGGQFVRFLSPQLSPSSYPSMEPYLLSMVHQEIAVEDTFNGTPKQAIDYHGTFEADGSITLTGTLAGAAGEPVHISGASLPSGIYTGNGPYEIGGKAGDVGENNAYSVIYRDLVAGFALGYWGGRYGNSTADWLGQPDFAAARLGAAPYATYDAYAQLIGEYSNAYAYSFNDVGPTPVAIPLTGSVATLRLTIEPDEGPASCTGSSTTSTSTSLMAPIGSALLVAPPPPRATVAIASGVVRLNRAGRALVTLRCDAAPCVGELALSHTLPRVRRKHARAAVNRGKGEPKARTVAFGVAAFSIPAGTSRNVSVPITLAGRRLLAQARAKRLPTQAIASLGPRGKPTFVARRALTLLAYVAPRRAHGRR